jgi:hypothetical protein
VVNSFWCNSWIETKFNISIICLHWETQEPEYTPWKIKRSVYLD